MRHLLSLDLSTTCTGWSVFDLDTHKLVTYGIIKPDSRVSKGLEYPEQQLRKMIDISEKIKALLANYKPRFIVVEEIAGSRSRLTQKTLDGLHWIFALYNIEYCPIIHYFDVSGEDGWRTHLQLRMDDADKANNRENKKTNAKLQKGSKKLPIIDAKDLAARYVNRVYGMGLDVQENAYDNDIADSVAMGDAWLRFKKPQVI